MSVVPRTGQVMSHNDWLGYKKKSAGTVLATYPAYWAFALPSVKDKQRSAHADMSECNRSAQKSHIACAF